MVKLRISNNENDGKNFFFKRCFVHFMKLSKMFSKDIG